MALRKKRGSRSDASLRNTHQPHERAQWEALDYLDKIKSRYADQPEIFVYFLDVLTDFKRGKINYFTAVRSFSTLFADNLDLIEAFNSFNPAGYRVECGADNNFLIIRVTTAEGTTLDTKVYTGNDRSGKFWNGFNEGFTIRQRPASSTSAPPEVHTVSSGQDLTSVDAPRLQILADIACRPSITVTAREALDTNRDAIPSAPPTYPKPITSSFQLNGAARQFPPAEPSLRFVQAPSFRQQSAWSPRRSYAPLDHGMDDSSRSGSSRESPVSSQRDASSQRKRSYVSMDGLSPVQDKPHSRNVFHVQQTFSEMRGPGAERNPSIHHTQPGQARNGAQSATDKFSRADQAAKTNDFKTPDSKSARTQDDSKPNKAPRSTKRQSGAAKSARTHTNRAFPCPFAPYGCPATFGSKNEWKRHINTQHMRLGYWRCDLCDQVRPNDFNRKDLFIQHMRRMHSSENKKSSDAKPAPKNDPEEQALAAAASRCWRHIHSPPEQSSCLFCDVKFSGIGTWDERLEHIGRHMELIVKEGEVVDTKSWQKDLALEDWLAREEIIVGSKEGGYTLAENKM